MTRSRKVATGSLMLTGFVVGFFAIQLLVGPASSDAVGSRVRPEAGTELLAIFVGSSSCGASGFPGLKSAIDEIRDWTSEEASREGKPFVSMGIALDQDPIKGIEFLEEFGPFDEISSGGSWVNTGALTYIVRDFPALRAIPQLILVERDIELGEAGLSTVHDRLIGRKVGASEIIQFAYEVKQGHSEVAR